ncbi:MAG: RNA-binding cell elongation regulator Jag/EloR, partial [Eubacteriales bacterium]|nr:RNA-binding cell elongation regulator Jag/EloR [Eubacteriales bacterium]
KTDEPATVQPKAEAPAHAPAQEAAGEEEREDKQRESRPRRERGGRRRSERRKPEKTEPKAESEAPAPVVEAAPFVAADPQDWSEAAQLAAEFLKNTTTMMGVEVTIELSEDEDALHVRMSGDTLGVLIGRRGETLDALQYLTSLYVNKGREGYIRVSLDSENYRAKREEALRKLALRMAQRARKTGHRVVLEPMNPYERRILHSALQSNPYVQTHSEGEDPYRRVIITLK